MIEWIDIESHAFGIDMHNQSQVGICGHHIAEFNHLFELPGGINVEQRKR